MLVSELKITGYRKNDHKVRAFLSITFDGMLAVERVRLVDNGERLFIAMPNGKKADTGEYYDYVFPVSAQVREAIENLALDAYNYLIENKKYKVIYKYADCGRESLLDQSLDDFEIFAEVDDINQ